MSYIERLERYEQEKQKLMARGISALEYEKAQEEMLHPILHPTQTGIFDFMGAGA